MAIRPYGQDQLLLALPVDVGSYIPEDDILWVVDYLGNHLDIKMVLDKYSDIGFEGYHPRGLIKVLFLGYMERITSSRRLSYLCRFDVRYMYLMGMDYPGFRTINGFRKNNTDFLKSAFEQMTRKLVEKKLIALEHISTDGSFILANAGKSNVVTEKNFEKVVKKLRKSIDKYMEECNRTDAAEDKNPASGETAKKNMKRLVRKLDKVMDAKKEMEKNGEERRNLTDPDARFMGKGGKPKLPGYNAQITVDHKHQLIVACDVVTDCSDAHQFKPQMEQVVENTGKLPEKASLDSGYHNGENLDFGKKSGIDCYIPDGRTSMQMTGRAVKDKYFHQDKFAYDAGKDCYLCPGGNELRLMKETTLKGKKRLIYGNPPACPNCPLKNECLRKDNKSGYRTISRAPEYQALQDEMRKKLFTEEGKAIYSRRCCTVEPTFGNIKENMGFRRFRLRGQDNVKGEFYLPCIGHNSKRLHKILLEQGSLLDFGLKKTLKLFWENELPEPQEFSFSNAITPAKVISICLELYLSIIITVCLIIINNFRLNIALLKN